MWAWFATPYSKSSSVIPPNCNKSKGLPVRQVLPDLVPLSISLWPHHSPHLLAGIQPNLLFLLAFTQTLQVNKELLQLNRQTIQLNLVKDLIRHVTKENTWMVNKHMKPCSALLVIKEKLQPQSSNFTSTRMTKIKKIDYTKCVKDVQPLELPSIAHENVKWSATQKTVWHWFTLQPRKSHS